MATKKKVEVILEFDSKGAVTRIRDAEGKLVKMAKGADRASSSVKTLSISMAAIGSAIAGLALASKAFNLLSESVELAGVQQIAERKLEQALLNTGDASEESAEMLKKLASEVQRFSNFGDEAIITSQALLLSFAEVGGAQGAALLTPRIADLQAGISGLTGEQQDLNAVTQAVGRALTQGSGALSRYGISMTDAQKKAFNVADGMEKVRLLAEILDGNFKGLAAATANPFTQAQNAVGDLKEALGDELRPELEDAARQFTQFVQDERIVKFAENTGNAIVEFGQGVLRFFQFSIPIAMNRLRSSVASGAADVLETLGKLDPRGLFGENRNPFRDTITSLTNYANAAGDVVEILIDQELQQSAARIQAKVLAEANRELAASMQQVNEAQDSRSGGIAGLNPLEAQGRQQIELTAITHEQIASRMELQLQELAEAERINELRMLLIEKEKEAQREAMVLNQMAAASNIKTAQDVANALRGTVQKIIQMHIAEAVAAAIPKIGFPANLILGPVAAIATNALFNNLVPAFATGTTGFGGGLALVGERGPELVSMGQGSNVVTNENTSKILQRFDAMTSPSTNVNVNNSGVESAISALGDRIERMQLQIDYFGLQDGLDRHNAQQSIIGG